MTGSRLTAALLPALLLSACGGGGAGTSSGPASALPGSTAAGNAVLSAALVDGPFRSSAGTVSAVNIAVAKVELVGDGGTQTVATFSPSQQVNLLDYQTSALQLGSKSLPAGHYNQVRLVLDTSNAANTNVVIDGTTYPLTIPSATSPVGYNGGTSTDSNDGPGTSGIKVKVSLDATAGQSTGVTIDFNAAESIVSAGSKYLMKPVLVATVQNAAGSISGVVKNNAGTAVSNAEVDAVQNGATINSGVTDANGNFQINALPAGSYTLVVNNTWTSQAGAAQTATGADGTAAVTVSTPVTVTAGQTTSGVSVTD